MSLDLAGEECAGGSTVRKFDWFKDANKTQRLENFDELRVYLEEKAAKNEDIVAYTHATWHPTHCMYISKIAAMAIEKVVAGEKDVYVPDMSSQPDHARHCERVIDQSLRNPRWISKAFEVKFGFSRCVKLS